MRIGGPAFCSIKGGLPFNKYEVLTSQLTPKGLLFTHYYFDNVDDAELYIRYLQQVEGLNDLKRQLRSSRTYLYEKRELEEFMETIDWDELPNKVKNLTFTVEKCYGVTQRTEDE